MAASVGSEVLSEKREGQRLIDLPVSPHPSKQDSEDEEDPLPGDEETRHPESVGEALHGLFSTHSKHILQYNGSDELLMLKRYSHGKSFRQRLSYITYTHLKTSMYLRVCGVVITVLACLLYIVEAVWADVDIANGNAILSCGNLSTNLSTLSQDGDTSNASGTSVFFLRAFLTTRHIELWLVQLAVVMIITSSSFMAIYVRRDIHGSPLKNLRKSIDVDICITILVGFMSAVSVLIFPICSSQLFVPSFLYCWPARSYLSYIAIQTSQASFFRKHQQFRATAFSLITFLFCFIFSAICFIHHFEQLGDRINLFDSYWLIVISFSTVGYGDIYPVHWTGKLVITFFIGAALIFLPPKVEKLWNSFHLHWKHHSSYQRQVNSKHVILTAVSLQPLVLRDFLIEFYADPLQIDTHTVLLVEHPLPQGSKSLLTHPVWGRRITLILGSAIKPADLARARAKEADACFVRTAQHDNSEEEADCHSILSAWTIKSYAPKCKLFVHILQPESKFDLHIADEVLCRKEIKNTLMANSCLCPGISTLVGLLLHSFKHETRGFKNEDFQWYEKCSPSEVYQVKLGTSRYFHHFVGRNFLFTSVVAYRRFNVALLGVCQEGSSEILINPGIDYTMKEDDVCYYISDVEEHNIEFTLVKPTVSRVGLWNASATLGLFSLQLVGMHLPPNGKEENVECEEEPRKGMTSSASAPNLKGDPDKETDLNVAADVSNWQEDTKRGLQLLHYYAKNDPEAKPAVKLSVIPKLHPEQESFDHTSPMKYGTTNPRYADTEPELALRKGSLGDIRSEKAPLGHHRPAGWLGALQRSLSHEHHRISSHEHHRVFPHEHHRSQFHEHHHSSYPLRRLDSGSIASSTSNVSSQLALDPQIVVEVDDMQEKEELELLEEGRGVNNFFDNDLEEEDDFDFGIATMDDGKAIPKRHAFVFGSKSPIRLPLDPARSLHPTVGHARYRKGPVPVLPYCGCESMTCYLEDLPRPLNVIRIPKNATATLPQRQGAMLLYSDLASNDLFHFVVPLRAAYLPLFCLRPVILILGQEPSGEFVSFISQLPMVHFLVGSLKSLNDLLYAGIQTADSLVVLASTDRAIDADSEHLVDASRIAAVHKVARLFPHLRVTTEVIYRYNIRFLYTTMYEKIALERIRHLVRKGDHLTYLFLPQFVSAKAFSSTMLDTLLYQAYHKPNIINLYRELLGCTHTDGSGYLWKVHLTDEHLELKTYVKLFHRLAVSLHCIPIGIYRTVTVVLPSELEVKGYSHQDVDNLQTYLKGRLQDLGMDGEVDELSESQQQQFVIPNPPSDFTLKEGDIAIVICPVHKFLSPSHTKRVHPPSAVTETKRTSTSPNQRKAVPVTELHPALSPLPETLASSLFFESQL